MVEVAWEGDKPARNSKPSNEPPIPRVGRVRQLCAMIESPDLRLVKNGVQAACEYLEANPKARRSSIDRLKRAVSTQLREKDTQVLRWIYKFAATTGDQSYLPYLIRQLSYDSQPENRTWAIAGIAGLGGDPRRVLQQSGDDLLPEYELAMALYASQHFKKSNVDAAFEHADELPLQWLGLLHGHGRTSLEDGQIRELTSSSSPKVVEYTIWGLRRSGSARLASVSVDVMDICSQAPNVRRWYYRLLASDPTSFDVYADSVFKWISTEDSPSAREGLARSMCEVARSSRFWRDVAREWSKTEIDPFVKRALVFHSDSPSLAVQQARYDLASPRIGVNDSRPAPIQLSIFHYSQERHIFMPQDNSVNIGVNSGTIGSVQGGRSTNTSSGDVTGFTSEDKAAALVLLKELKGEGDELERLAQNAIESAASDDFLTKAKDVVEVGNSVASLTERGMQALESLANLVGL